MYLKDKYELVKLDDQIIAVPISKEGTEFQGVIKLNETAAEVFRMLEEDVTENEIIEHFQRVYNVDDDYLKKDVRGCIEAFRKKGLLTE